MAAKRNKTKNEEVKVQTPAPETEPQTEAPVVDEQAQANEPAPINADEMAANIKVSGNSYEQYARQMFKDRLEEGR